MMVEKQLVSLFCAELKSVSLYFNLRMENVLDSGQK